MTKLQSIKTALGDAALAISVGVLALSELQGLPTDDQPLSDHRARRLLREVRTVGQRLEAAVAELVDAVPCSILRSEERQAEPRTA